MLKYFNTAINQEINFLHINMRCFLHFLYNLVGAFGVFNFGVASLQKKREGQEKERHHSILAVPIFQGISGAFSHTVYPGGRALAFHQITPGHLTILLFFTLQQFVTKIRWQIR